VYRISDLIGKDGTGEVHRARDDTHFLVHDRSRSSRLRLAVHIATALEAAHNIGIIHW
jgi:hypothetical protein